MCAVDGIVPKALPGVTCLQNKFISVSGLSSILGMGIFKSYSGIGATIIGGGGIIATAAALPKLRAVMDITHNRRWNLGNTIVGMCDAVIIGTRDLAFNVSSPRRIAIARFSKRICVRNCQTLADERRSADCRNSSTQRMASDGKAVICVGRELRLDCGHNSGRNGRVGLLKTLVYLSG